MASPALNSATCPGCSDSQQPGMVVNPTGQLWQPCPLCGGTGVWAGAGAAEFYGLDVSLTANQVGQVATLLVKTGTDFQWKYAIAKRTGSFSYLLDQNGNQYQTVYNAQGVQTQSGLQDVNFWGTGTSPFPLPDPIQLGEQARFNLTLSDLSGAPNTINFFFVGAKFKAGTLVNRGIGGGSQ